MTTQTSTTTKYLDQLLDDHIKPNARRLAEIIANGDIAVLFVRRPSLAICQSIGLGAAAKQQIAAGQRAFALPDAGAKNLAKADHVTARWVARQAGPARILVIDGEATLLVNKGERGFSLEQGSTDAELIH